MKNFTELTFIIFIRFLMKNVSNLLVTKDFRQNSNFKWVLKKILTNGFFIIIFFFYC